MKCPTSKSIIRVGDETSIGTMVDCLKEECAWWDPSLRICCIRTIAGKLDDIDTQLENLAKAK